MAINLSEIETRVVGSLVEKALTTPEYYPLTLNTLISACNQKSNRDPVMSVGETNLLAAIDSLHDKNLVYLYYGSTSRTVKYKHMMQGTLGIGDREVAVLAVLFLRGPQTVGELRERTGRLYEFSGIGEVQEVLDEMSRGDEPLVVKLERLPGTEGISLRPHAIGRDRRRRPRCRTCRYRFACRFVRPHHAVGGNGKASDRRVRSTKGDVRGI